MAQQAKSRNSQGASRQTTRRKSSSKTQGSSSRSSNGARAQSTKRRPSPTQKSASARSKAGGANKKGTTTAAKEAVTKGANSAGSAISTTAEKLKTPAIATGAGLAGLVGGMALTRNKRRKVLGMRVPHRHTASKNLAGAAKNMGALAERTGQVAEQVRVASEALSETGTRRRSPIEVVLQGLTARSRKSSD